ncbi:hypothetical protein ATY35_19960 [Vibrio cidicii]|uniref:Recombination-associated protein RdgC n=1 Tax=Vibrio cidicii TaxID=1763883 RepID=A0ABR5W0G0_9VIBR|nr:hypothetical protein [Vibrio cidicii]KYN81366.1 hypothetical protein ATY35_19960 [Vibrio cidicii]
MSKETKRRTINYKLVKLGNHPLTLQQMLEATLLDKKSKFHKATIRRESLTEDGNSFRFINRFTNYENDMLLCQIVQFEQGLSQMTIVIDEDADMFEVNPISAKDIKQSSVSKEKRNATEFLESMAYFGVMGNHMVVMGSQALKSRDLERYLQWYLNTLTEQNISSAIILSDKPTAKAMKQLETSEAKSVSIGSDILYEQEVTAMPDAPKTEAYEHDVTEAKSVRWRPSGLGADILELLKNNGYIGAFDLNETLDDANLQVSIEFKYSRKTTKSGQKVIDTLSSSLRHLDKEDVKINLKGGGEIKGDDLKLSHQINLGFYEGKVDEPDLYYQMKKWLQSKISTQEVTPDLQDIVAES